MCSNHWAESASGHAPGQLYTYPARCWRKKRRLNILEDPRLVPIEFKIGKWRPNFYFWPRTDCSLLIMNWGSIYNDALYLELFLIINLVITVTLKDLKNCFTSLLLWVQWYWRKYLNHTYMCDSWDAHFIFFISKMIPKNDPNYCVQWWIFGTVEGLTDWFLMSQTMKLL